MSCHVTTHVLMSQEQELSVFSSSGQLLGSLLKKRSRFFILRDSSGRKLAHVRQGDDGDKGSWTFKGRKGHGLGHLGAGDDDDDELTMELSAGQSVELKGLLLSAAFIIAISKQLI